MSIQFSKNQLNDIFPFYLLLDGKEKLIEAGESMRKLLPDIETGASFFESWVILRPSKGEGKQWRLDGLENKLVVFHHRIKDSISFKGHFVNLDTGNWIFLGTPVFSSIDDLTLSGLSLLDFSLNDSMVDLLHVLKTNDIVAVELKELLDRIQKQKGELAREKANLESTNQQLSLFRSLISSSSDAVQVAHEDGQLFYINQEASKRLGIEATAPEKFKVQDFEELFQVPGAWESHLEELKKEDFLTLEGININLETGKQLEVEVTAKFIQAGGEGYVVAFSRDVSERKENERRLKLQEEKFRNIISNMNLGLMEVDEMDTILYCNQSFVEMSGFPLDELIGTKAGSLFLVEKESQRFMNDKTGDRLSGNSDSYEILIRNKHGDERWWFISGGPRYNDKGETTGSIGIHLDITEHKRLEKELEIALNLAQEASVAKEAFLANMSHEIRTPLNGIVGMIRELKKESLEGPPAEYLKSAEKATQHLLSVVNNILDITRIESGELLLETRGFSPEKLFEDVHDILRGQAESKEIAFQLDLDNDLPAVLLGDVGRLRQVFLNLTGNAIKFTQQGQVMVKVQAGRLRGNVQPLRVSVRDTGIGMSEEYRKRLFQKFQQEDASTSRRFGGSGLGLFITKQLLDLMQGRISVQSIEGLGTEMTVDLELPLGDELPHSIVGAKAEPGSLRTIQILLVEDNPMNRLVASNALVDLDVEIQEAENGAEAVDWMQRKQFDLVLMDIQMPVLNGIEATRTIRKDLNSNVPIVALSANAFKSEIEACKAIGMDAYVTKPFEERELVQAVLKFSQPRELWIGGSDSPGTTRGQALIKLDKLREMGRGDSGFVTKMLGIFGEMIPPAVAELREAYQVMDLDTLRKVAHQIKPSIDNIGLTVLNKDIRALEKYNPSEEGNEELGTLLERICTTLNLAIEEVSSTQNTSD